MPGVPGKTGRKISLVSGLAQYLTINIDYCIGGNDKLIGSNNGFIRSGFLTRYVKRDILTFQIMRPGFIYTIYNLDGKVQPQTTQQLTPAW